jgi:hypothetical protein
MEIKHWLGDTVYLRSNWSRALIFFYFRPGGRFYELGSIVTISSGINIVTSSVAGPQDLRIVISGYLLSISGMLLFLVSARVSDYHNTARDRRLLGGTRSVQSHLESLIFEETRGTKLWREFFGVVISILMIISAFLLTGMAVSTQSKTPRDRIAPTGSEDTLRRPSQLGSTPVERLRGDAYSPIANSLTCHPPPHRVHVVLDRLPA